MSGPNTIPQNLCKNLFVSDGFSTSMCFGRLTPGFGCVCGVGTLNIKVVGGAETYFKPLSRLNLDKNIPHYRLGVKTINESYRILHHLHQ